MSIEKVAVVTGGNKGIGYAIVKGLCKKFNGITYLTARDVTRGEAAVEELKKLGFQPRFHQLDITDQTSVDKFRDHIKNTYGGFDLLVNNAAFKNDAMKPLGVQAKVTVSLNYFGTLRVCEALFPLLRNNAKVVNVSSRSGHLIRIPTAHIRAKFSDPLLTVEGLNKIMEEFISDAIDNKAEENGWGNSAYIVSKVGVTALTILQQTIFDKEQPPRNISINAVHPGFVDTDMSNHEGHLTIEEGAKAPLFLALESNLKGKYVWLDCEVVDWYGDSTPY